MQNFPSENELKKVRKKLKRVLASRSLADDASPTDRLKFCLCEQFVKYQLKNNLTQREMAKILKLDEAIVSKITHYYFDEFTVDRLMKYLSKIHHKINISVDVA